MHEAGKRNRHASLELLGIDGSRPRPDACEKKEQLIECVNSFCSGFESQNGELMASSIDRLMGSTCRIPSLSGMCVEFPRYIVESIRVVDEPALKRGILKFLVEVLYGKNATLSNSLLKAGLLRALIPVMTIDAETLELALKCLINIAIDHSDEARALLDEKSLEFCVGLMRETQLSESVRVLVPYLITALASCAATNREVDSLLLTARLIMGDSGMCFGWTYMLKVLDTLVDEDAKMAKYVMLDKEFHSEVNQMLLLDEPSIVVDALAVIRSYYKATAQKIPTNTQRILQLCSPSPCRLAALGTLRTLIDRDFLEELAQLGLFEILKSVSQDGSYAEKKEALNCMVAIIHSPSDAFFLRSIEFNFMEDLITMLESDVDTFSIAIGSITKMLRRRISDDHLRACHAQFFESGAIETLQSLASNPDPQISTRASRFLDTIVPTIPTE